MHALVCYRKLFDNHWASYSSVMALKKTRISTTTGNSDRISDLPDAILCHILSFLPTIDSVRTRLLSTRWKHIFSLVPVLLFDYSSFYGTAISNYKGSSSFLDFVDWVFNSYNVNHMDTFHFSSNERLLGTYRLLSWISESIHRRVRKIKIHAYFNTAVRLPRDIFTCKTLSVLNISGHFDLDVPENVRLPCVKTMGLVGISLIDGHSAHRLFRCCPLLEDLSIKYLRNKGDIQVLDISISSLKILKIYNPVDGSKFDFVLDIPDVENFVCYGGDMAHVSYSLRGLKSSAKAYINLYMREGSQEQCKALGKLVRAVSHIRHLRFGSMLKASVSSFLVFVFI